MSCSPEEAAKGTCSIMKKVSSPQTVIYKNSQPSYSGGIGFVGLLTLLFITLKLLDKINWSWWWVLSPLWISAGIGLLIFLVILIFVRSMF